MGEQCEEGEQRTEKRISKDNNSNYVSRVKKIHSVLSLQRSQWMCPAFRKGCLFVDAIIKNTFYFHSKRKSIYKDIFHSS